MARSQSCSACSRGSSCRRGSCCTRPRSTSFVRRNCGHARSRRRRLPKPTAVPSSSTRSRRSGGPRRASRLLCTTTSLCAERRAGRIVQAVPYATRPMHDADSHIMEPADWLHPYLDTKARERFPLVWETHNEDPTPAHVAVAKAAELHSDPSYRADDESQITLRKNFFATGSFLNDDRPAALDLLGFTSQLVFDTFTSPHSLRFDRDGDHEMAVAIARAQHRAVLDWCSVDPRLLPVTVVPVGDMPAAIALGRDAI